MPYPVRKVAAAFTKFGGVVERPRSGSHWKLRRDGRMYPIPAHRPGAEVNDRYINKLCRSTEIDLDEFVALL